MMVSLVIPFQAIFNRQIKFINFVHQRILERALRIAKSGPRDGADNIRTDVLRIPRDTRWKFRQSSSDLQAKWWVSINDASGERLSNKTFAVHQVAIYWTAFEVQHKTTFTLSWTAGKAT